MAEQATIAAVRVGGLNFMRTSFTAQEYACRDGFRLRPLPVTYDEQGNLVRVSRQQIFCQACEQVYGEPGCLLFQSACYAEIEPRKAEPLAIYGVEADRESIAAKQLAWRCVICGIGLRGSKSIHAFMCRDCYSLLDHRHPPAYSEWYVNGEDANGALWQRWQERLAQFEQAWKARQEGLTWDDVAARCGLARHTVYRYAKYWEVIAWGSGKGS